MVGKKERDEVWKRNEPYMDNEDTIEELLPFCKNCPLYKGTGHDFSACRGKHCMELWLSNEYLEWCASWSNREVWEH